ncbi:hypothetical protein LZ30DRAFT_747541 [Colletotrichum cereale]|nr:hypothetical protein LZ30DRAFT_747541 [Colletotrichum cereale]
MTPWEPQPPGDAIQTTSHEAMQPREEQKDKKIGQPQSQPEQNKTAKEGSQSSAASARPRAIRRFWSKHVSVVVGFEACRDHLGYLRTGAATATLGTVVAQLFAMQPPDSGFGYTAIGKPLATACYCFAMCITLLGALRVWRLQHALLLGKTLSGGFEIMTVAAGCLMLSAVYLSLLIALDVVKESSGD